MRSGQTTDLFEMLRRRRRAGSAASQDSARGARSSDTRSTGGRSPRGSLGPSEGAGGWQTVRDDAQRIWGGLRSMVSSRFGGTGGDPEPAPRRGADGFGRGAPGGALLLVVLAVGLVLGFTLGRVLPSSAGAEALSTRRSGDDGQTRGVEGARTPGPRTGAGTRVKNEYEVLSDWAYLVLPYAASDRPQAERLAAWLRGQGFDGARLVYLEARDVILVVVYVDQNDMLTWGALRALEGPSFEDRWSLVAERYLANQSSADPKNMPALLGSSN